MAAGPPNPILPYLRVKGLIPFRQLMSIARTLSFVERASGFRRKFRELIGPASHATLFEFEMAEVFARTKWAVDFLRTGANPTPDFTAIKEGLSVAVEARRQLPSEHIGVAAIHTTVPPPIQILDVILRGMLRAQSDVLGSIGIVVVLPSISLFEALPQIVWVNPAFERLNDARRIADELTAAFSMRDGDTCD